MTIILTLNKTKMTIGHWICCLLNSQDDRVSTMINNHDYNDQQSWLQWQQQWLQWSTIMITMISNDDDYNDNNNDDVELPGWPAPQIRRSSWRVGWTLSTVWWYHYPWSLIKMFWNPGNRSLLHHPVLDATTRPLAAWGGVRYAGDHQSPWRSWSAWLSWSLWW